MSWLIQSFTCILPNISFTGGSRSSIERACARNHSRSYASGQSRSHEAVLYLLSEHVSVATMLFGFLRPRPKSCHGEDSCVFAALGAFWDRWLHLLGRLEYVQKARGRESPSRTFSFQLKTIVYKVLPFTLCQTCSPISMSPGRRGPALKQDVLNVLMWPRDRSNRMCPGPHPQLARE